MQDVTKDRDKYIGGSDVAAILNISKFKTRWELLKEKAGIDKSDFEGNVYTEYGNVMEPKIREYINKCSGMNFVEGKIIDGYLRYHADGVDVKRRTVLEIKTTSTIHDNADDYDYYLCQLLLGMDMYSFKKGVLAVYERPEDFNEEFDPERLSVYMINGQGYVEFIEKIKTEIESFRADWLGLLENPFLTEEDLQPKELVEIADKVLSLESQLEMFKQIEKEYKEAKASLKAGMERYGIKKWETPNGTKITLIPDGEPTEKWEFDVDAFAKDNDGLYRKYCKKVTKKGKAGYVRITAGKE